MERRPHKEDANFHRRIAIQGGFPNLRQIANLPHIFVEFVETTDPVRVYRRFYASTEPAEYFCYIPTPGEREFGRLPEQAEILTLYQMADLEMHTMSRENVIRASNAVVMRVTESEFAPSFEINRLVLERIN